IHTAVVVGVAQYGYSITLRLRNKNIAIGSKHHMPRLLQITLGENAHLKARRKGQLGAFRSWNDLGLVAGSGQNFRSREIRDLYVVVAKRAGRRLRRTGGPGRRLRAGN